MTSKICEHTLCHEPALPINRHCDSCNKWVRDVSIPGDCPCRKGTTSHSEQPTHDITFVPGEDSFTLEGNTEDGKRFVQIIAGITRSPCTGNEATFDDVDMGRIMLTLALSKRTLTLCQK